LMARRDTSSPLNMTHVVEATHKIDPEAVEAMILETDARFDIDSTALIGLSGSQVPPRVIDLMVAMSFPERFRINRQDRVAEKPARTGGGGAMGFDPFWAGRYSDYYWSYWNPFYIAAPFGYYSFYEPYYSQHYVLTNITEDSGGKVVRGQGYSRIQRVAGSSSRGGGDFGSGRSSGVSSSGYSGGGGGGSGRSAKPRN